MSNYLNNVINAPKQAVNFVRQNKTTILNIAMITSVSLATFAAMKLYMTSVGDENREHFYNVKNTPCSLDFIQETLNNTFQTACDYVKQYFPNEKQAYACEEQHPNFYNYLNDLSKVILKHLNPKEHGIF